MLIHLTRSYGHLHEQGQSEWGAASPAPPRHLSLAGRLSLTGHRPLPLHTAYLQSHKGQHISQSQLRARNIYFFSMVKPRAGLTSQAAKGDVLGNAKKSTAVPCPFS